jgi:hypothetical protein
MVNFLVAACLCGLAIAPRTPGGLGGATAGGLTAGAVGSPTPNNCGPAGAGLVTAAVTADAVEATADVTPFENPKSVPPMIQCRITARIPTMLVTE